MKIKRLKQLNIRLWILVLLVSISSTLKSQVITLSTPTTGPQSSNTAIILAPGFRTTGPFHASISEGINAKLTSAPSQNQNYVRVKTYKEPSSAIISDPTVNQQSEIIQYFDGLGRASQIIQTKGSRLGRDVILPAAYDPFDREYIKFLPYAEQTGGGTYQTNAIVRQGLFYSSPGWDEATVKTTAPFMLTRFEASPFNRLIEQGSAGTIWQPSSTRTNTSGRTVIYGYGTNNASVSNFGTSGYGVRMWEAIPVIGQPYKNTLLSQGMFGAGELRLKIVKDENWTNSDGKRGTTEEYTDRADRLILKRTFNSDLSVLSTYYVYDDLGNLSFVLPPESNPDAASISQNILDLFCYQYRYDAKNRLVEKKIPGKGWDYTVYNRANLIVLTQDSVQRTSGLWTFSKYDGIKRLIITGIYASVSPRTNLQTSLDSLNTNGETPITTGIGYSNSTFPQTVSSYLTVNYYDDYTFPGAGTYPSVSGGKRKGLLTGRLAYVLGTNNALLSVSYYDNDGRLAKIYAQHYQSGSVNAGNYDEITNTYNFEDNVKTNTRIHHNVSGTNTTIAVRYDYDHMGRKLRTYEKINSDPEVLLSENVYNEVGQLAKKSLNDRDQSTSFSYNERGWLNGSMSNQFSFQLKYANGTTPQFNGNISGQTWGAGTILNKNFVYSYDKLNRLVNGTGTGMSEIITYSPMGNILSLNRDGVTRLYSYSGNRLTSTSGAPGSGNYIYDGNGNTVYDGRIGQSFIYNRLNLPSSIPGLNLNYTYDADGNKLTAVRGTAVTNYVSGIQYLAGSIDLIQTEEGIARRNGTSYSYEYNLTDHLGNVRYTFFKNPVNGQIERIQSDDYYPFGLRKSSGSPVSLNNKYLYNGKELQEELTQYDFSTRFYDPVIGHFTTIDPLAEKMTRISPYAYGFNNPIRFTDPDGMEPLDDYKLLKNGEIKFMEKTNDNFDRLYATNSNNTVNNDKSIILDKGVLGNAGTGQLNTASGSVSYDYYQAKGEQATELFKFSANNSDVEWGLSKFSDGKNYVTTSHSQTSEAGTVGVVVDSKFGHLPQSMFTPRLTESTHSHPGGVSLPSGLAPQGDNTNRGGDMSVLRFFNSMYFYPVNYNIYTGTDGKFTPYSSNSYMEPLKEVIITAPRRKR